MNVAILGAGAWGTALAISLSARHRVTLWTNEVEQAEAMSASRSNQRFLPDIALPQELQFSANLEATLADAELALVAVPTSALRIVLRQVAQRPAPIQVIWACKGFEADTAQLPHQVAEETLPQGGAQCGSGYNYQHQFSVGYCGTQVGCK